VPVAALVVGCFRLRRADQIEGRRADPDLLVLSVLLVGGAVLSIVQHDVAGTAYLADRRAIFLLPLYGLVYTGLFTASWNHSARGLRAISLALSVLPLALVVHFLMSANLSMTRDWAYDSQTKNMMNELEALLPRSGPQRYDLGVDWVFQPSINYYLVRNGWTSIGQLNFRGAAGQQELYLRPHDAYYISDRYLPDVEAVAGALRVVKRFDRANAILAVPASHSARE
jgi:hypothetical protein